MICSKCGTVYVSTRGACPKCGGVQQQSQKANLTYQNQCKPNTQKSTGSTYRFQETKTSTPVKKIRTSDYTSNSATLASVLRFFFVLGIIGLIGVVFYAIKLISSDFEAIKRAGYIMLFVGGGASAFSLWVMKVMIGFLEDYQRFVGDTQFNIRNN